MSIFDEQAPTTEQEVTQQPESFLEQLVAKKGDQFRDPEAIAKKALHADEYIEELKAKVAKLSAYEELVESLKKDPKAGLEQINKPKEEPAPPAEPKVATLTDGGDIESQLEQLLTKREVKQKTQSNLQVVEQTLEETFGERAGDIVKAKAEELGLSLQKLSEMAAESPKAFFNLVGVNTKEAPVKTFIQPSINGENRSTVVKNRQYYEQKMRENPKLAYDPKFGDEMYRAILAEQNKR